MVKGYRLEKLRFLIPSKIILHHYFWHVGRCVPFLVVTVFLVPRSELYVLVWVLGYFICHFLGYKQKSQLCSFLEI